MRAGFTCLLAGAMLGLLTLNARVASLAQNDPEKSPKVSETALTADQLAVYRAVLGEWTRGDRGMINLAMLTEPMGDTQIEDAGGCFKGHEFEMPAANLIHRIREPDLVSLGDHRFRLVDPEQYSREIEANDPQKAIVAGETDKAVDNAIAHGLMTLVEIRFDESRNYAVVPFSFWCGMTCGHGNTWLMKKSKGNWRRTKMCGGWVS